MTTYNKYRIYCITENEWKYTYGTSPPTTCPTDPSHAVNPNSVSIEGEIDVNYLLYAATAGNVITVNSNITTVYGNVASYLPIAGPGQLVFAGQGTLYTDIDSTPINDNAQNAYNNFMALTPTSTVSAPNIGGMTFTPGVIALTNPGGVTIGGTVPLNRITLDGEGQYVFQVTNGGLTTDTTSNPVFIELKNGARASQVYWAVNGDVNLQTINGNVTTFEGTIISQGNITMGFHSSNQGTLAAPTAGGSITFNDNTVSSQAVVFSRETNVSGYVTIESSLADNKAIQILASNTFGGIFINAGSGGIMASTTNAIGLNAGAQSHLMTSNGNLILEASNGLIHVFAPNTATGGINIGTDTTPIINIGNTNGNTAVNVQSATEGINLTATGGDVNAVGGKVIITATTPAIDSIRLDASAPGCGIDILTGSQGLVVNSNTGQIEMVSDNTAVDAIRLDTSGSSGGIFLAAGSSGISIGNDGIAHPIVIGNTVGTTSLILQSGTGDINIGNDGVAKTINIGQFIGSTAVTIHAGSGNVDINSTDFVTISANTGLYIGNTSGTVVNIGNPSSTTAVNIDSGTFGITIGNNSANGGPIQIGNTTVGKDILIGNTNDGGKIRLRWGGNGGFFSKYQDTETSLPDNDTILTMDDSPTTGILPGVLSGTPTANRTLTLPTPNDAVTGASGVQVGDSIDFSIINNSTAANNASLTLIGGPGVTFIGRPTVDAYSNGSGTYFSSGSGLFRLTFTNVTGTTSYKIYRLA